MTASATGRYAPGRRAHHPSSSETTTMRATGRRCSTPQDWNCRGAAPALTSTPLGREETCRPSAPRATALSVHAPSPGRLTEAVHEARGYSGVPRSFTVSRTAGSSSVAWPSPPGPVATTSIRAMPPRIQASPATTSARAAVAPCSGERMRAPSGAERRMKNSPCTPRISVQPTMTIARSGRGILHPPAAAVYTMCASRVQGAPDARRKRDSLDGQAAGTVHRCRR